MVIVDGTVQRLGPRSKPKAYIIIAPWHPFDDSGMHRVGFMRCLASNLMTRRWDVLVHGPPMASASHLTPCRELCRQIQFQWPGFHHRTVFVFFSFFFSHFFATDFPLLFRVSLRTLWIMVYLSDSLRQNVPDCMQSYSSGVLEELLKTTEATASSSRDDVAQASGTRWVRG